MIKKVLMVRGIGVLHDAIEEPVQFSRITIIYGENGRGKSTKSAIFSSLCTGLSGMITGRRTSGGKHLPEVAVLIENNLHEFKGGVWSSPYPRICVFDSAFVDANVYSGLDVSSDHRRKLLDFALGEKGVELKQKVDNLTHQISIITSSIGNQKDKLELICSPLSVKNYLSLENDQEIDKKISDVEKTVEVARKAKEISEKENLRKIVMPDLDISGLGLMLSRSLTEISAEAKRQVTEHINTHLQISKEYWIKEGMELVKTTHCPFCGLSLDPARPLLEAYTAYFDQTYNNHIEELKQIKETIEVKLSDAALSDLSDVLGGNNILIEFWKGLVSVEPPMSPSGPISEKTRSARGELLTIINRKLANPITAISDQNELGIAHHLIQDIKRVIDEYNEKVLQLNKAIEIVKSQAIHSDLNAARAEVKKLRIQKERHEDTNRRECETYNDLAQKKKLLEQEKVDARSEFESYTQALLIKYESTINYCLEFFGAGFRIVDICTSNEKGLPRVNYKLQLGSQKVELGTSEQSGVQPVFANTLSDGDRRTLAFSFFLSKLEVDGTLSEQIIIIDDPVSSFDQSRRWATHKALRKLAGKAKQLIVLSHDALFVQSFAEHSEVQDLGLTVLELRRSGYGYSVLEKCDIDERVETEYKSNYRTLMKYVTEGEVIDKQKVVRSIRPMLEANLRHRFQDYFKGAYSLGKMIEAIRISIVGNPLEILKLRLNELNEINDFATEFTHDSKADGSVQQLDDAQLKKFCERALLIARGT